MNKLSKILMFVAFGFSNIGFSESISFGLTSLKSGYVPGIGRIEISPEEKGLLRVSHDPNICDTERGICTQMPVHSWIVEATVIEDSRPADGDLLLGLTEKISLSVGSGFNIEGLIYYSAIVKTNANGEGTRVPLKPNVSIILSKQRERAK
ncbi:MAG: hypothetical protein ACHQYQ_03085 [Bacteriovoracales bacterium]